MAQSQIKHLLWRKEQFRIDHGIHIENNMEERGSRNHKTKVYYTCQLVRREINPTKKNARWNRKIIFRTFDTYEEALEFGLARAKDMLDGKYDRHGENVRFEKICD